MFKQFVLVWMLGCSALVAAAGNRTDSAYGWPAQKAPTSIITCSIQRGSDLREMNLAQSVAGLAAQSLNEGKTKEGVWISVSNPNYAIYYRSLVKRLHAKEAGSLTAWQLVDRYVPIGIIKGYVLYDVRKMDNSVNLATVYAGLMKGILVDLSEEATAREKGLVKLFDASAIDPDLSTFLPLKEKVNRNLMVLCNPEFSNNRDYAIAHKSLVWHGVDSTLKGLLEWIQPLSPVIGWNKGGEFQHIEPCTRRGLINTASDWCVNLSLLSIYETKAPAKIKSLAPKEINWNDQRNCQSFVMSDGDNMQWTFGDFISSKDYWSNPSNSGINMSFTSCVVNLSAGGRDVYDELQRTQPAGVSVVEYGGGYFYPDLFATATGEPEKWLRELAKRMNKQMKLTGVKVLGFICRNMSGEAAQRAYRIFAEEIEELTGIIAVQYSPYNAGRGKIFWVKNRKGAEIPVVTARYQLWHNLKKEGSGNPAELVEMINEDDSKATATDPALSWTIVHAWSRFNEPGKIVHAVSDSEEAKRHGTGERGVTPVKWIADRLSSNTRAVSIEELLWRIRMQYHPEETKKLF
ncbi:GxGYxYP domain-containing protein [Pseudobacter ginsenosidimutans]|uniref:GxGYxY motif-containing protein n=1 Tax=Pseudobacter ginsenosidimutans TaxID=661488 RepID=A0A4Q7MZ54_9BACT|nr:GxGYxYP domain-containing protein [Pseudobacter ginsenosidimutans]RZS74541.1 GxGYxY motif-containing protein [Pseudobacter ginsenosidimutans]